MELVEITRDNTERRVFGTHGRCEVGCKIDSDHQSLQIDTFGEKVRRDA